MHSLTLTAALFAATPFFSDPALPQEERQVILENEPGKIVIYRRGSVVGAAIACPVRSGGRDLVELGRGRYAELDVEPGRHILENKNASVEVSVLAGETRYIRCQIKSGFMSGRADFQIVDGSEFLKIKADLQPADLLPSAD
jgi:hypothetical protein